MSFRALSLLGLLLCALALPSSLHLASAANRRPVAIDVCHDSIWGAAEYCGRDAYVTTGVPEMNHDCIVDGMDVALFIEQFGLTGSPLSADLDADGVVDEEDVLIFAPSYGQISAPCAGQTPSTCQGTIALSFDPNPANIDPTENQAPGIHTVYVVIDGYTDASYIEYAIHNSANIIITDNTLLVSGGHGLPACNAGAFNDVVAAGPALSSGPVAIAEIEYQLLDTSPATLTIKPGNCPWSRVRWMKAGVHVSYDFANVFSAGINTPAPPFTPCTAPSNQQIGTVSGKVFADHDEDCSFDVGSDSPEDHVVQLDPGPYLAAPNGAGDWTCQAPAGSYTVSLLATANDPTLIQGCQNNTHSVNVPPNDTVTGVDFAVAPRGNLRGRVYADISVPFCTFGSADFALGNRRIVANPGGYTAVSDHIGNYDLLIPPGEYTFSLVPIPNDPFVPQFCQVPSYDEEILEGDVLSGRDFALLPTGPSFCGTTLNIIPHGFSYGPPPCNIPGRIMRRPCPGTEYEFIFLVSIDPLSTFPAPASGSTLAITLDSEFIINSVTSASPITIVSSNGANERTLQFDSALAPGMAAAVMVRATPMSGGPYDTHAEYDNGGLCGGLVVADRVDQSNCGCDPNQLAVQPEGCGEDHEIVGDETMIYTIDFENVGPGPAHDIRIEDQLDADLDMSSLRVVASSHDITAVQLDPGNLLVIRFDGIELAGTFGPGSTKGYVILMVDPQPGLADGTLISSTAAITFDFNEPVITNTVMNTIMAEPCPVTGVSDPGLPKSDYLGANFPNPFNPTTTIEYGLASPQHVSISIYNVAGERVRTLVSGNTPAGRYTAEWNGRDDAGIPVASGVYLSRMTAGAFSEVRKLVLLK